jgi:hypothetical protein
MLKLCSFVSWVTEWLFWWVVALFCWVAIHANMIVGRMSQEKPAVPSTNINLLTPEPGAECRQDWPDPGGGWNGGLHHLWTVAGSHQNLQVGAVPKPNCQWHKSLHSSVRQLLNYVAHDAIVSCRRLLQYVYLKPYGYFWRLCALRWLFCGHTVLCGY